MKHILRTLYCFICFSVVCMVPAHAYLDPSVMTYAIQIVAGIAVAVGAIVGVYWRKAKKLLQDKFGIDENANKEVEPKVEYYGSEPLL